MYLAELRRFLDDCVARMRAITDHAATDETRDQRGHLTAEEDAEFSQLERWVADATEQIERLQRIERAASFAGAIESTALDSDPVGEPRSIRDGRDRRGADPWNLDEVRSVLAAADPEQRGAELRSRALDCVERAQGLSDRQRETLARMVEDHDPEDGPAAGALARHVIATSSPEYLRAWTRAFRAGTAGRRAPEAEAVLERAMSLTDNAGGYAVPQQLDPTLILTSDGSTNPIRELARKVLATGDTWTGLSTTHASWSWDGEAGEVSDDSTTFAQPSIPNYKAQGFIPFSIEIGMDYPGLTADLQEVLARGKDDAEAAAFVTGTGSSQPTGFVTALTGGSSLVASATTDTFAIADVYNTEEALPAKYRARGNWVANKAIYNDIRQFGTADSHALWTRLGDGQPERLLGYPAHEASAMDGTITGSAHNYVLALADWWYYVITDRMGFTMELVPHLFATGNNRPSGQRGFYAWFRVGADSVNDGAFRLLNVT